jgi:hypothetical protein
VTTGRLLPLPSADRIAPADRDAVDRVLERFGPGAAGGYFDALLNAPAVCEAINSTSLVFHGALARGAFGARERELVDIVVASELRSRWMLGAHLELALAQGIDRTTIRAIWAEGRGDDGGADQTLVDYIRAVVRGTVDDEAFAGVRGRLGDAGAIEYTAFVCWVMLNTRLLQALGVPEISDAQLSEMLNSEKGQGH